MVAYKGNLDNPTEILIIEAKQFRQNKILDEFDGVANQAGYDPASGLTINPANPKTGLPTQMSTKWTFEHVARKLNIKGGISKKLSIALENEDIVQRYVFAIDKSDATGLPPQMSDAWIRYVRDKLRDAGKMNTYNMLNRNSDKVIKYIATVDKITGEVNFLKLSSY